MSNYVLLGGFIIKVFRELFLTIDSFVYMIARGVFEVFCFISEVTIEKNDSIVAITNRFYAILGILLVFIISYNLLTYIIDPDKMTDNKVGASAVIKDIVIALVIITLTPTIFTKLYAFQNTIITSGVISNLVLGGYKDADIQECGGDAGSVGRNYIKMGANNMAANVFTSFFFPSDAKFDVTMCDTPEAGDYQDYCDAYDFMINTGSMAGFDKINTQKKYEYYFLFSTVAGVVLIFFMLSFCLNLAKRVFKMALLQLIAPIPVVMELIPNKKGTRKKWIDTLIQVYLEVFFFQAVIFIVMFLITLVPDLIATIFDQLGNADNCSPVSIFVKCLSMVFLIFGLLQFGKEAPQMIFDLLGIKSTGTIGAAAKRGLAMFGVTGGLAGSTIGRFARNANETFQQQKELGKGTGSAVGSAIRSGFGGAGSGLARNLWGARNVHNLKDARNLRRSTNKAVTEARVRRDAYWQANGQSVGGVLKGHRRDIGRAAAAGMAGYLGTTPHIGDKGPWNKFAIGENEYREMRHQEDVHKSIKAKYDATIGAKFKNDARISQLQNWLNNLDASGKYRTETGEVYDKAKIEGMIRDRKNAIVNNNLTDFQDYWGAIQSIVDANQGVKGVTSQHFDLENFNYAMHEEMMKEIAGINPTDDKSTGGPNGFKPVLDELESNTHRAYQYRKQTEQREKEAKEEVRKAAEASSNKGKKDN